MKFVSRIVLRALVLALVPVTALAAPAAPAARQPLAPSESKQFGDWVVRCYPVNAPSPCDMFELLANKQTQQRIMSISLAYVPANDRHVIQIAVPLGVFLPPGLIVQTDAYTSQPLHYRRCDRGGCYVEMLIGADAVSGLQTATGGAKIKIFAENGKTFELPFSLNGFNDAHGALQDMERKHASAPKPAAPAAAPEAAPEAPAPDAPAPTP